MALFILQPDADGNCCECNDRNDPCETCGDVTQCLCALCIPPQGTAYGSLAAAQSVIDGVQVSNCIGFVDISVFSSMTAFTATQGTNQIILQVSVNYIDEPSSDFYPRPWASVALNAGTVLSVNHGGTNAIAELYDADRNLIDTVINNGSFIPAPSASTYYVKIFPQWPSIPGSFSITTTLSASTLFANPIIARYLDNEEVKELEACPKFVVPADIRVGGGLPPWTLGEDAFANIGAANAFISGPALTSCLMILFDPGQGGSYGSSSASGGTSLTMSASYSTSSFGFASTQMYGCIIVSQDSTILTLHGSSSSSGTVVGMALSVAKKTTATSNVYDEVANENYTTPDNTLLVTVDRGIYIINSAATANGTGETASISSTITVTANKPIQTATVEAAYNAGLSCYPRVAC